MYLTKTGNILLLSGRDNLHDVRAQITSDTNMPLQTCTEKVLPDPDVESSELASGAEDSIVLEIVSPAMAEVDGELTDVLGLPPLPIVGEEVVDAASVSCGLVFEDCPATPLDASRALTKAVSVAAAEIKESKTVSGMTVSTASPPRPVYGEGSSAGIVAIGMRRLT